MRKFGARRGTELHDERSKEHKRRSKEADNIRAERPDLDRPGKITQLAQIVKMRLDLNDSVSTIRKNL